MKNRFMKSTFVVGVVVFSIAFYTYKNSDVYFSAKSPSTLAKETNTNGQPGNKIDITKASQNSEQSDEAASSPEERYLKPEFTKAGFYKKISVPISFKGGCSLADTDGESDLVKLIEKKTGLDSSEQFPVMPYSQLAQFWTEDGKYFQITANMEFTSTNSYNLIYKSASDVGFEKDQKSHPIPGYSENTFVSSSKAKSFIQKVLQEAKSRGATEGTRIIEGEVRGADKKRHNITFFNSSPMEYHVGKLQCTMASLKSEAECRCDE